MFMIPIIFLLLLFFEMKSLSCVKWININKISIYFSPLFYDRYNLKSNCKEYTYASGIQHFKDI